jgi:Ni/Co efflux regulator RcnB
MNKIMVTAALLVATSTAMAAPGWQSDSRHYRGMDRGHYSHPVAPPRGYYGRVWHRGERFVPYGGRVEVLRGYGRGHDYRGVRLYVPPRGAQWVRVNNDALLTAIATGLVLDVVYNMNF